MPYEYKDHTISIDLWFTLTAALERRWNAEVFVRQSASPKTRWAMRFRHLVNSREEAENRAKAFVEKWIDDGKPPIQADQLD
jgi:hypothetical protein